MTSISYELAVRLKEAGFPMRWCNGLIVDEENIGECAYCEQPGFIHERGYYILPTLSELIAACGKRFSYLHFGESGWTTVDHTEGTLDEYGDCRGRGSTAEEAVANLWLALNQKETP